MKHHLSGVWPLNSLKEKKQPEEKKGAVAQVGKIKLPKIDLGLFFDRANNEEAFQAECAELAKVLHLYGAAAVQDPRVDEAYNDTFLDMMERYFALSDGKRGGCWLVCHSLLVEQIVLYYAMDYVLYRYIVLLCGCVLVAMTSSSFV